MAISGITEEMAQHARKNMKIPKPIVFQCLPIAPVQSVCGSWPQNHWLLLKQVENICCFIFLKVESFSKQMDNSVLANRVNWSE